MIMRACSVPCALVGGATDGMPTSRPDERDQSSVEPGRSRSPAGRQTLGEPTRRWQAIHEPTRPTTYRTLRASTRTSRRLTYKSAIHPRRRRHLARPATTTTNQISRSPLSRVEPYHQDRATPRQPRRLRRLDRSLIL